MESNSGQWYDNLSINYYYYWYLLFINWLILIGIFFLLLISKSFVKNLKKLFLFLKVKVSKTSQKFKKSQIIFNCLKNKTLTESTLIPTEK